MQNASTLWKMKNVSLTVTIRQFVSLLSIQLLLCKCLDTYVLAPGSPRGNPLDSRGRSHPAILSIWEHINFQKPWIGGSSHHMCLSVPFSLHPPPCLSGLLSNISLILLDVSNHCLHRVYSVSKSSFVSYSLIYSITFIFNFAAIFSLGEICYLLGKIRFFKIPCIRHLFLASLKNCSELISSRIFWNSELKKGQILKTACLDVFGEDISL